MQNCAVCGQPMNYIKAGYSKTTGRPYQAFYACSDKNHKQPRQQAQTPVQQFNQSLDQDIHEAKIKQAVAEKRESIALMNAKNNATLLLANKIIIVDEWPEWVKKIHDFQLSDLDKMPNAHRDSQPMTQTEIDQIPF